VSEDDLIRLLSYVRTLGAEQTPTPAVESPQSAQQSSGAPPAPATSTTQR
jgi:hypothetical protein